MSCLSLPSNPLSKHCSACNQTKHVDEFYNNKSTKDGFAQWCKDCTKAYRVVYYNTFEKRRKHGLKPEARIGTIVATAFPKRIKQEKKQDKLPSALVFYRCCKCHKEKEKFEGRRFKNSQGVSDFICDTCVVLITSKICRKCDEDLLLSAYAPGIGTFDGLLGICRDCTAELAKKAYAKKHPNRKKRKRSYINIEKEERECGKCSKIKPFSEYYRNHTAKTGVQTICRDCNNKSRRKLSNQKIVGNKIIDLKHPWYNIGIKKILSTKVQINKKEVKFTIDNKSSLYLPIGCSYKMRIKQYIKRAIEIEDTRKKVTIY